VALKNQVTSLNLAVYLEQVQLLFSSILMCLQGLMLGHRSICFSLIRASLAGGKQQYVLMEYFLLTKCKNNN
jgi:hypothetical protein